MLQPNGFNHPALSTSELKQTLFFFNETLGLPLVALYWMHGADNTVHAFLGVNDSSLLGFVYTPNVNPDPIPGITYPSSSREPSTRGTMHHMAFNVDSIEALENLKEKIQAKGIECQDNATATHPNSFEFAGPDGMILQVCCKPPAENANMIDPEAARAIGLDEAALQKFMTPQDFARPAEPVPNAALGEDAGYHMNYPTPVYKTLIGVDDQLLFNATKDVIPPTQKQTFDLEKKLARIKLTLKIIVGSIFNKRSKA